MKRFMIAVLAIALVAAPGFLVTSFAVPGQTLPEEFFLRCERDWFGHLKVRQFDSPDSKVQLEDLPPSCADALAMLLSSSVLRQCLRALPSGFNGVLYLTEPQCVEQKM